MKISFMDIKNRPIKNNGFLKVFLVDNANAKITGIINNRGDFFSIDSVVFDNTEICTGRRLKVQKGGNWLNYKVVNRDNKNLGYVSNLYFDKNLTQVLSVESKKGFFGFIKVQKRIFDIKDIFAISGNKIILNEENKIKEFLDTIKKEIKKAPKGAF
jgi:uncharacterized protein YrrD